MSFSASVRNASRLLTGLVVLILAGSVLANPAGLASSESVDVTSTYSPADAQGRYTSLIEFDEPSLLEQHRSRSSARFDYYSPANLSARDQLMAVQARRIDAMSGAIGRSVEPTHHYLASRNGIAARLTPAEAERLASLDGVAELHRERLYQTATFRGPEFIGADTIWDGSAVPDGSQLLGEGMIAAVLDSGIPDPTVHPSFVNDPACGHGTGGVPDKVISFLDCSSSDGGGLCNGADPIDENGHGSHTASTVAGNFVDNSATPSPNLPAPFTSISGVAPCAHIRSYDVCNANGGQSCGGADIGAGLESVLIQNSAPEGPISSMNYSISGGASPWNDFDRDKLDLVDAGVFVAASAGNTSTAVPDPVGAVNHRGPWVMSVAASTHDGQIRDGIIDVDGGPSGLAAVEGSGPALGSVYNGTLRAAVDVDPTNVEGCNAFTAGAFDGEAALIARGTCPFADKVNNAVAAGADFVIVYTDDRAVTAMGGLESTTVSSFMIENDEGLAIESFLAGGTAPVTVDPTPIGAISPDAGDILADFSLRGPTASPLQDLQKPNITAPGVSILAGVPGGYAFLSGTSMSSPHVAGAGLLVRQAQPSWTVSEVKSAMQMTSVRDGFKEDGTTPWDWDDVGHGRVDLTQAALAGLVMDETTANYLAANPSTGGDVKTLNTPDVRNLSCSPSCSFTRTLRNTQDVATSWTVTPESFNPDLDIQVTPSTFSFTGDTTETVTLTIEVTPQTDLTSAIEFGQILIDEDGGLAPQAHLTVAISGTPSSPPEAAVDETGFTLLLEEGTSGTASFNISNVGTGASVDDLTYTIEEAAPASVVLEASDREADPAQPITLINDGFAGSVNRIGVADQSILWFNQLTPGPTDIPFTLEAVQRVEFPNGTDILQGDEYDVYVWSDPDRVPGNGDEVLLTEELGNVVGAAPALVSIPLSNPVEITADTGDVLIGIVNRTQRADSFPANSERTSPYQNRAWIAFNFPGGVAGDPPDIANAATFGTLSDLNPALAGNWVIRGLGTGGSACLTPSDVPWLTVTPTSGSVAAGASEEVVIDVDTTGLATGSYEARVCVNTNDANNPVFVLPVSVEVTGVGGLPTIGVTPASVDGAVDVLNPTSSESFDISNSGNDLDLEWTIGEAEALAANPDFSLSGSEKGGPAYALGSLNGSRLIGAAELAGLERVMSAGRDQELISVDGYTTGGTYDSGDPDNSSLTYNIGAGNQIVGVGWEVNIATVGASWLSESTVAIVTASGDETGLFLSPGAEDGAPGTADYSSNGILLFADAEIDPIVADGSGNVYLEWHEGFDDAPGPDSNWSDSAAPVTLPAGLTLLVEPVPTACDFPSDVSWVSVNPTSGTTVAGGTSAVTVDFDATGLDPGLYEAVLCIDSNDPATPLVELPVSMDVTVPANGALIEGTVQGLGYCQANPAGAAGANIEIVGGIETFNVTADGNGAYSLYLDEANGPVDITASAPNHISQTDAGVTIAGQTTTTADFDLVLEEPCAQVSPGAFSEIIAPGDATSGTFEMTIENALGGVQLEWGIQEADSTSVDYGYDLQGGGELVSTTGSARGSESVATTRAPEQSPFVDAGIQGAPVSSNFTEAFDDITLLPGAGWSLQNLSDPLGTSDWFQGNADVFPAQAGDPTAYIGANFNNTTGANTISNWLMTPEVELRNGTELRFWSRVPTESAFADRLEVRLSTSGSSTFAGSEATDVGDFDTLLLTINEDLTVGDYPEVWTEFTVDVSGLSEPTSGRFALRYFVTNGGPSGANSSYIGVDTVSVSQPDFCSTPDDVPWLSVAPFFGATDVGESDSVDVTFDASGLDAGSYEAFICVSSNDEQAGTIQVPFSLEVLGDGIFQDRFEQ
jgi:hypothetical protein